MEVAWKWWLRFMGTVALLLVIALLVMATLTVPRVWTLVETAERAVHSVGEASEEVSDSVGTVEEAAVSIRDAWDLIRDEIEDQ
jgi:hypothetical protein